MNKRQKKKRLEREKKEVIKGIDYIEGAFTKTAEVMCDHYNTLPDNEDKFYNDFFIAGFEFSLKQLALAKHLLEQVR